MRVLLVSSYIEIRIRQTEGTCLHNLNLKPKSQGDSRLSHCFSLAEYSTPIRQTNGIGFQSNNAVDAAAELGERVRAV